VQFEVGKVCLEKNGIEKIAAHVGILQLRGEAYSSCSKKNVNDSRHAWKSNYRVPLMENALTAKCIRALLT
jgi:hypothetical protein